jgi:hypothetical protein
MIELSCCAFKLDIKKDVFQLSFAFCLVIERSRDMPFALQKSIVNAFLLMPLK